MIITIYWTDTGPVSQNREMRVSFCRSTKHGLKTVLRALPALLVSLLFVFPVFAQAQPDASGHILVIVDFPSSGCGGLWPVLKHELEHSETPKLLPGSVLWMRQDEFHIGMDFKQIYGISLQGDCGLSVPMNDRNRPPGPLGWVLLVNKHIQPFVYVDCSQVAQMLGPDLQNKTIDDRRRIFARAISRIVVHEMTHVVTQSTHHDSKGLQKARVTPYDLLAVHKE
jgi:hypothetical protein